MKRLGFTGLTLIAACLQPVFSFSQATKNFLKEWTAVAPESDGNNLMTKTITDVKLSTTYFDGLGRSGQSVIKQGSLMTSTGANNDLVKPFEYDFAGREIKKYLPYVAGAGDGLFKDNATTSQNDFYAGSSSPVYGQGENTFYEKIDYDPSPLNRVAKTYAPGSSWAGAGRGMAINYWTNTALDVVRMWIVTDVSGSFGTYSSPGVYNAGQLYKNVSIDENNEQVIEFKDKEGKVILKKVQVSSAAGIADDGTGRGYDGWQCTYYIYDDLGNLRAVIQPKGVDLIKSNWILTDATILAEQCFRYAYDSRNHMVMKQVPGAAPVYMVYDQRDRLVMTQDGNLRATNQWLVSIYDDLNRVTETGLWTNSTPVATHWASVQDTFPYPTISGAYDAQVDTYYDNYSFPAGNPFVNAAYDAGYDTYLLAASSSWPYPLANVQSSATNGLVTGTRSKILGTTDYLYTVNIYDKKGRIIQTKTNNITNTSLPMEVVTIQYSWAGQPLIKVEKYQLGGSLPAQSSVVVTRLTYDNLGRLVKTEKRLSNSLVNSNAMGSYMTISTDEYDALGQLKTKKIGNKPGYPGTELESFTYDYNIRGWLLGMNRDYAKDVNNTNKFGFDLGYDKANNGIIGGQTYTIPQYNGNIEGMVWKSAGDGEKRKYDFTYDNANRLLAADFNQYTDGAFNKSAGVDFSVKMGDGSDYAMAYDANGNILKMQQWGLKVNASSQIDNLTYNYVANSNKLLNVIDAVNDAGTKLGDFRASTLYQSIVPTKTAGTIDYTYDANGNLKRDYNKDIGNSSNDGISYNYLNLPAVITVRTTGGAVKGTISYTYDAGGIKLKKETIEYNATVPYNESNYTTDITTTTLYMGGIVYESRQYSAAALTALNTTGVLQFIAQEEGRIRFIPAVGATPAAFAYDYFIKDHLGNMRMVLTEEQKQDIYPVATLEGTGAGTDPLTVEQGYYTITGTNIVPKSAATGITDYQNNNGILNNNPNCSSTSPIKSSDNSQRLYKLNNSNGKMGLGITLKVMSGDVIDIFGKSYYFQNNTGGTAVNSAIPILDLLIGFLGSPGGITGAHGPVTASGINTPVGVAAINSMWSTQTSQAAGAPTVPKAYINYLFFDEQFKCVSSGFSKVGANSVLKDHHSELTNLIAPKSGYVYIYCSNESPVDVFFDNMQVVHTRGPILEETHYYPFGLTMAGISDKALKSQYPENKYLYNGKEMQNSEFADGSGLEEYDYGARMYDPQIGRWNKTDGKAELYFASSPYVYASNQPTNAIDPDGNLVIFVNGNHFGDGGKPDYWRRIRYVKTGESTEGYHNYIYDIRFDMFDSEMESALNDNNSSWTYTGLNLYKDGSNGGWGNHGSTADDRAKVGYKQGQADAAIIIANLARDKTSGVITETIKIVAHSMGAAYAKGYIQAIVEYAKAHPAECNGLSITEYDIAAFQPNQQEAVEGVTTNQFVNDGDDVNGGILGFILGSSNKKEKGATTYSERPGGGHGIWNFQWILALVNSLPQGTYVWDKDKQDFVPKK